MNILRVFRTVCFLKPQQIIWQLVNRLWKPSFVALDAPDVCKGMRVEPAARPVSLCSDGTFEFLNIRDEFGGWNNRNHGMLWAYNQNYMDWLNQPGILSADGAEWIDRFIDTIPENDIGLDPYPTSLRIINWVKFFSRYPNEATEPRLDSLYSQMHHLERRLERHLMGNHLLEDAYALYVVKCYFGEIPPVKLLLSQLQEQILPDGAHYEQSVMYHCILLDRLLDCLNIGEMPELRQFAVKMLGYLEGIVWSDGTIPMVNDAAEGVAPNPAEIFSYARRLGLRWRALTPSECGYRRLTCGSVELLADVGGIAASYQPGHSHADALNYELRIDGKPVVVDTGISTYDKTSRRQYERSTAAHNTVTPIDSRDSSEVWGGFRVGRRCKVSLLEDTLRRISATHSAYGHIRTFELTDGGLRVIDRLPGEGINRIHLAPGINTKRVHITQADRVVYKECKVSSRYNMFETTTLIEMYFHDEMSYEIH